MSSEIRRYPWLFIDNPLIRANQGEPEQPTAKQGSDNILDSILSNVQCNLHSKRQRARPFNDVRITHEDVIMYIHELDMDLTSRDLRDIAINMHPSEILKLIQSGKFFNPRHHVPEVTYTLDIEDIESNLSFNNSWARSFHQERMKPPGKSKITSYWAMNVLSAYIDVLEILSNKELRWNRACMSGNESITVEHLDEIDSGRTVGEWDYRRIIGRSDVDLSVKFLRDSIEGKYVNQILLGLSSNPDLTYDYLCDILKLRLSLPQGFWDNVSRSMNIREIEKCVMISNVESELTPRVWMNPSLTRDYIHIALMISPEPQYHILSDLKDVNASTCDTDALLLLLRSPYNHRLLEPGVMSGHKLGIQAHCKLYLYQYIDINIVDMRIPEHFSILKNILTRSDITEDQVRRIVSTCTLEQLKEMGKPRSLAIDTLIDIFGSITPPDIETMRSTRIDQLETYPVVISHDCRTASIEELQDIEIDMDVLRKNPRLNIDMIRLASDRLNVPFDELLDPSTIHVVPIHELLQFPQYITPAAVMSRKLNIIEFNVRGVNIPDSFRSISLDPRPENIMEKLYSHIVYRMYDQDGSFNSSCIDTFLRSIEYYSGYGLRSPVDVNRLRNIMYYGREDVVIRSFKPMGIVSKFHDLDIICQ